jgi:hypothetical protein
MRKYRSDSDDGNITSALRAQQPQPEAFLQYIENYESHYADGEASMTELTIDDEFKSYVNSVPNPKLQATLDPLKFWAVSIFIIFNNVSCQ